MGLIFGNNGDMYNSFDGMTFHNGPDGESDDIIHSGGMAFGNEGIRYDTDSMSFFGNKNISKNGDIYFCDGNSYSHIGNMLFGPDGKIWGGNMTDCDIRDIIEDDN